MTFQMEVYKIVKEIPEGSVSTYGEIALRLGKPRAARQVGWALHQNKSANVPCHRVVDRRGRLAQNFAFDGFREQRRRLLAEGVKFIDDTHVNIKENLWV